MSPPRGAAPPAEAPAANPLSASAEKATAIPKEAKEKKSKKQKKHKKDKRTKSPRPDEKDKEKEKEKVGLVI